MSMPIIKSSGVKRKDSITDIVESVALEQTALSHILNAEGEKIQKILEDERCATSNSDILKVNESVQTTINSITRLETILQGKLELFKYCLCVDDDTDKLKLKITLNKMTAIDESVISFDGNFVKINLPKDFPRTVTFSGISAGTITTTTPIDALPTGVTLTNNVLTVDAGTSTPLNVLLEVKLANGLEREIYTINVISQ
jgi:hypothetical protein